jgi:4-amino-4-deoxy-L-arabinose transferase-like glycosyltransferase
MKMKSLDEKNLKYALIIILMVSILSRLVVALWMGNDIQDLPGLTDQVSYHTLALRVIDGHGFTFGEDWWPATRAEAPTSHWSFLYTFYLIIVYSLFGPNPLAARVLQVIVVGILQPLLLYKIGEALFNRTVGLLAAALLTLYTYLIYYAPALLTEPFYITSLLAALYLSIRMVKHLTSQTAASRASKIGQAAGLGICIGLAVLLRQLFLLFVPFLFLWIAWSLRKQWRTAFLQLAVAGALVVAMIAPVTIYNYTRFGMLVLLNTNSGFAFYWANHPVYGTSFESIISPEKSNYLKMLPDDVRPHLLSEAELDRELLKRGIQFILDDPGRYILLSLSRIPSYFMFWPTPGSSVFSNISRVASFGILWPFMLYGVVLAIQQRGKKDFLSTPVFLALLFCVIYSMIHILTWTLVRYRLPVDAVLLPFAGLALIDLYTRFAPRLKLPILAQS